MIIKIKGFITSKKSEFYSDCADNYAVNENSHRFSVSDGVSKSFFPKVWSEILVTQFVERKDSKEIELIKICQNEWQKTVGEIVKSFESDPKKWHTRTLYNRREPALATFVGLKFFEKEKKWEASAWGDSFLFFVPKVYKDYQKELIKLSSKSEPVVFDNFPDYLTSIGESHKGKAKLKSGNLRNGTFYLMTDALAEWFINEGENAIGKISVWQEQSYFEKFIMHAREENKLTNDDCAILCIEISESERNGIKYEKRQLIDLNDLINDQESEKEKIRQKKLAQQQLKQENEEEIQKAKELEDFQNETLTPESLIKENNEEPTKEGFVSKVKGFFSGKEKEGTKETLPEKKIVSEMQETEEQNSEQLEQTSALSNPETKVYENHNVINDKNEVLEKEKVEEEAKIDNEKTKTEKLEPKEQKKVDSKTKNILDKF